MRPTVSRMNSGAILSGPCALPDLMSLTAAVVSSAEKGSESEPGTGVALALRRAISAFTSRLTLNSNRPYFIFGFITNPSFIFGLTNLSLFHFWI